MGVPILQLGRSLIVPVQGDLHDQQIQELQDEILGRIERISAHGLILEVSSLDYVDSFMARVINDIASMAGLMGVKTVIVGMQPTVAIVLMDLGLQLSKVPTARNLEHGLALLAEIVE